MFFYFLNLPEIIFLGTAICAFAMFIATSTIAWLVREPLETELLQQYNSEDNSSPRANHEAAEDNASDRTCALQMAATAPFIALPFLTLIWVHYTSWCMGFTNTSAQPVTTINWLVAIPAILFAVFLAIIFITLVVCVSIGAITSTISILRERTPLQKLISGVFAVNCTTLAVTGWLTIAGMIVSLFIPGF